MSVAPFARVDASEQQAAFTGLLAHPLVAPWTQPELFRLVNRHREHLERWCNRAGYRLVRLDQCYRLRRSPIAGRVAVPAGPPAERRTLVLALLVAAVLENERHDGVTLQEISDAVRRFAPVNGFRDYDPDQWSHRKALVEAIRFLITQGVLEQRTQRADLLDNWERAGVGIGAGYLIHRDAMVALVDSRDADAALRPNESGIQVTTRQDTSDAGSDPATGESGAPTSDPAVSTDGSAVSSDIQVATRDDASTNRGGTPGHRLLRELLETQALDIGALTADETQYLLSQRHRLIDQAEEMTGGVVEIHQDVWLLVLPTDHSLDRRLLVSFPDATAVDWASLAMLDAAIRLASPPAEGRRRVAGPAIHDIAADLFSRQAKQLTVALRESPAVLRQAVQRRLTDVGLIVVDHGDWVLLPPAARFRDATLEGPAREPAAPDALFEEDP